MERSVDGFLIEGFHENGAESGSVDMDTNVLPLLRQVVERLPDSKPRMYMVSLGLVGDDRMRNLLVLHMQELQFTIHIEGYLVHHKSLLEYLFV